LCKTGCRAAVPAANKFMPIFSHKLEVATRGRGLYEITNAVAGWLNERRVADGLLTVFVQHTSASLIGASARGFPIDPPSRRIALVACR
jgi:hypothetical protein